MLRLKKCTESVYPVKDSHMKYTFHPDKGTSYSVPASPPKVIQKAIFNNIQSESCDEVEIAA